MAQPQSMSGCLLDAIGRTDGGLGLSDLRRESGLAKASAYRLAEQLVSLGAVRRHERRYYIGARLGRIGQRWEPDPPLRTAARPWVHTLAVHSKAVSRCQSWRTARGIGAALA
jgi:DNA-binding IclR family transcriptional regulator